MRLSNAGRESGSAGPEEFLMMPQRERTATTKMI
jgi:hypothetical protein